MPEFKPQQRHHPEDDGAACFMGGLGVVDHFDFADGEGGGNEDGDAVVGRYLGIHGVAAHLSVIAVLKRHGIGGVGAERRRDLRFSIVRYHHLLRGSALHADGDGDLLAVRQSLEINLPEIIEQAKHVGRDGDGLHSLAACGEGALTVYAPVVRREVRIKASAPVKHHFRLHVPSVDIVHMLAAQACSRCHGGHEGIAHAIYPAVPRDTVAVERSHKAVALGLHGQHSMSDVHINQAPMVMHIVVQLRVRNRDLRLAQ